MAMQKAKSGLASRLGPKLDQAVKNHANDPTEYGRINLPPGINNGVAKLVECGFGIYKTGANQGKDYFRAAGVVLEPSSVTVKGQEVPVAGLQTSIMIPLCETKNQDGKVTSLDEQVGRVLNEMRKLGAETRDAGVDEFEALADMLKEAQPYFRFSTSQSAATPANPDPRVWENWNGSKGLADYVEPEDEGAVVDNTVAEAPARPAKGGLERNGTNGPATTAKAPTARLDPTTVGKPATDPRKKAAPPPEPEPEPFDEFGDIDSLIAAAGDDDSPRQSEAQDKLREMATAAGATEEEIEEAADWEAVSALIEANGSNTAADDEGADTGEWEPKKGEIYKYLPLDPKTKKPGKGAKPVECEVTSVETARKLVTLKNLDDPKRRYADVPFTQLIGD